MSFLRKRGPKPAEVTQYTGLQIQSSSSAVPIPIVYGVNKCAGNLIWYGNFIAYPQYSKQGGKGGGGRGNITGYNYTTAFVMGLCEGPIGGVLSIWKDQEHSVPAMYAIGIVNGSATEGLDGVINAFSPGQALAYRGVARAESYVYWLGQTATIGNLQFEVFGRKQSTAVVNGFDADPAEVIYDFLTSAQYGVGFPAGSIDADALYIDEPSATVTISIATPGVVTWTAHGLSNGKAVHLATTGGLPTGLAAGTIYYVVNASTNTFELAAEPAGASIATSGTQSGTHTAKGIGGSYQAYCQATGIGISPVLDNRETANSSITRWLQLTNATAVWSEGKLKFVPYGDEAIIGRLLSGVYTGYAPNITPLFDLSDDDFVIGGSEEDPITVERKDESSIFNVQQIEINYRQNGYNSLTVTVWDQNSIEQFRRRDGSTVTAHEICDLAMAQKSAQLILQREIYIRNTYTFKLGFEYCLLEPMDIVALTDAGLGLQSAAVRITSIEEGDDGTLTVIAEEFPGGTGKAVSYPVQTGDGTLLNRAVVPSSVNPPIIFEPPAALTSGERQIWIAVSGGLATTRRLEEDSSTGAHLVSVTIDEPIAPAVGTDVIFSAYVLADERTACRLRIHDGVALQSVSFDLAGGTSSGATSGITASSIVPVADGSWFQVSIACQMAAAVDPVLSIVLEKPLGTISYAGTAGEGLFVWAPQLALAGAQSSIIAVPMTPAGSTFDPDAQDPPLGVEGTFDPYWGGCVVYISTDNATYGQVGQIDGPARMGATTATLGSAGPTLSLSLVESGGTLDPASPTDAANGATLSLVEDELLAYSSATLTGPNAYDLGGLVRGFYGTTVPASHPSGSRFARLDNAIFKFALPAAYVGQTIYLKFQSFNIFGLAAQDLATCATYVYTPTGAGIGLGPILQALALGQDVDLGAITEAVSIEEDLGQVIAVPSYTVDLGTIA